MKAKYAKLREQFIKCLRTEQKAYADWNILLTNWRHLGIENETLKCQNETLQKENNTLKKEILRAEEINKNNVYNDFNLIIKEKEEKFENEFPPIE